MVNQPLCATGRNAFFSARNAHFCKMTLRLNKLKTALDAHPIHSSTEPQIEMRDSLFGTGSFCQARRDPLGDLPNGSAKPPVLQASQRQGFLLEFVVFSEFFLWISRLRPRRLAYVKISRFGARLPHSGRKWRFYIQYPRPVVDCAPNVTADRPAHWSAQSITGCGYCLNVIGVLLFLLFLLFCLLLQALWRFVACQRRKPRY